MARMTGAEAVVQSLTGAGVDTVFGIISIHNLDLHDVLYRVQDRVRYIGGRLELALGFMADGYARATGRPGVLVTSTGPGAADSVGAMGEAYFSGSPVLQLTTNVEQAYLNSGRMVTHEPKDQLGMFRAVTDWNALVPSVEAIPDHVYEAFRRFQTRRPRPVELEVPTDLLGATADVEIGPVPAVQPPAGEAAQVEEAARLLLRARRPVIWAGEELHFTGGTEELVRLAEALGCPVVTGDGAKGVFPEDHPLSLGQALGNRIWGTNPVFDFLATCDAALVVGAALPFRSTAGVGVRLPRDLVHVTLDGDLIGKNYPARVGVTGNGRLVLQGLLREVEGKDGYKGSAYQAEVARVKASIYAGLQEQWPNELRAFEAVRAVLPREAIVVLDATVPTSRASRCLPVYGPRSYFHPHGWAGLGFAFPAALGAKAGCPDRPVVCITGDGGFQYNLQELGTAVQEGIAPIVVVFNDNAWGVLKGYQQQRYGGRVFATELVNPDFVKLAEAYGVEAERVDSVAGLCRALGDALGSERVRLIEVRIPHGFGALR